VLFEPFYPNLLLSWFESFNSHPQLPPWAMSSRCNLSHFLLIDLSSMLDGYTILRAWITCLIWASEPAFLHWIQVLHEPAAHNHGREEGRFPSRLDYLIRGTKPNGIVDQIMKASLETLNGRPSFYSQPKASFLHFNDHLIGLENVDFVLVNLAFKHTSSHNRSRLASLSRFLDTLIWKHIWLCWIRCPAYPNQWTVKV